MARTISFLTPKDCEDLVTHAYDVLSKNCSVDMKGEFYSAQSIVSAGIKSAENGNETIIAAPEALYDQIKYYLLTNLSVKIRRSAKIANALGDSLYDQKKYDLMTAVPEGAEVYTTSDGLYSVFKFPIGSGTISLMSLDSKYFDESSSLYFNSVRPENPSTEAVKANLDSIEKSGLKIAIAESTSAAALMKVIESLSNGDAFSCVSVSLQDRTSDEATAKLAKVAKETGNFDYGVSISEPGDDGSISVSIADSDRARVAVVHPLEGEDFKHLLGATIVKLCDMMSEATEIGLVNPDTVKNKHPHRFLILSIIVLAVAAIICTVFCVKAYHEKSDNPKNNEVVSQTLAEPDTYLNDPYFLIYLDPTEENTEDITTVQENTENESEPVTTEKESTTGDNYEEETSSSKNLRKKDRTTEQNSEEKVTSTTKKSEEKVTTATNKAEEKTSATTKKADETSTSKKDSSTTKKDSSTTKKDTATTTKKSDEKTTVGSTGGKFVFTCYGYGHGCGMSQEGAIAMAKAGSSAEEIIKHYYPGTTIKTDSSTPMYTTEPTTQTDKKGKTTVTKEGVMLLEFLCRTVKQEIGQSAPYEALKAQAIVAYTYGKRNGFKSGQAYDPSFAYSGTRVEKAVMDMLNISSASQQPKAKYVDYGGRFAQTFYFASSAGKTANGHTVYSNLTDVAQPYLVGGVSSPETVKITTREFTADEMKELILAYDSDIKLDSDPANWLKILSHDNAYSKDVGYVTDIRVGSKEISGRIFREKVLKLKIKSHCFTVEYVK